MKRCLQLMLVVGLMAVCVQNADAFGGRRRGGSSGGGSAGYEYVPTEESTAKVWTWLGKKVSLQDMAQMRADAMAKTGNLDHGIAGQVKGVPSIPAGFGEGIGMASSANDPKQVSTCVAGSRVMADASCRSKLGAIFRVRFWR